MDLPARSFDLSRFGVEPPLQLSRPYNFLFCIASDVGCWTATPGVYGGGVGGIAYSVTDLAACQSVCIREVACVAIDWEPSNPEGLNCWILTSTLTRELLVTGVITHYVLNRRLCLG